VIFTTCTDKRFSFFYGIYFTLGIYNKLTNMKKHQTLTLIIAAVLVFLTYTQITIFIIPPIGALPEGKTIIITRLNKTEFIDSPDGMCDRIQGGVSLLCRGIIMGAVVEKSTILLRLPYSSWLYSISTGGKEYDR
jgi:hypothetical protein